MSFVASWQKLLFKDQNSITDPRSIFFLGSMAVLRPCHPYFLQYWEQWYYFPKICFIILVNQSVNQVSLLQALEHFLLLFLMLTTCKEFKFFCGVSVIFTRSLVYSRHINTDHYNVWGIILQLHQKMIVLKQLKCLILVV